MVLNRKKYRSTVAFILIASYLGLLSQARCTGTTTQDLLDTKGIAIPLVLKSDFVRMQTNSTHRILVSLGVAPYSFRIVTGSGSIDSNGIFSSPTTSGTSVVEVQDSIGNQRTFTAAYFNASKTPNQFTNLMRWYKFDNITTSGAASSLTDYSGQNSAASQGTPANQPIFIDDNGKYALDFDSAMSHYLTFDGSFFVDSSFTVFFVVKFTDNFTTNNFYLGGTSTVSYNNLQVGLRPSKLFTIDIYNLEAVNVADVTNVGNQYYFITARFEKTAGTHHNVTTFINEKTLTSTSFNQTLISFPGAAIGRNGTVFLKGRIYEIAMFQKSMGNSEVNEILCYLSGKFSPKLATCY